MKTVTVKTAELEGAALDWAVAKAKKPQDVHPAWDLAEDEKGAQWLRGLVGTYSPSRIWAHGGPIIEERNIGFSYIGEEWLATLDETTQGCGHCESGPTHLVAAMRAIVAAELGDTVEIPEELV